MNRHSGRMLHDVLELLEKNGVFEFLGKEKTRVLLRDIVRLSYWDDCESWDVLQNYTEQFGICSQCLQDAQNLSYGMCSKCREEG